MLSRLLSIPYSGVVWARNVLYDTERLTSHTFPIPIISVGNITVGGSGKTPIVISLTELLRDEGYSPVVLSRGYGGSHKGPYLLQDGDEPSLVGDEPLLIRMRTGVPVVIARKRVDGVRTILSEKLGTIIILDDGLQHRALARSGDIIVVDVSSQKAQEYFLNGELLPLGRLREHRASALRRAGSIILSHRAPKSASHAVHPEIMKLLPDVPVTHAYAEPGAPYCSNDTSRLLAEGDEVVAVSGIANPAPFHSTLESRGYVLKHTVVFPDHHSFSSTSLERIVRESSGLPCVCTEKDATKLLTLLNRTGDESLRGRLYVLPITTYFSDVSPLLSWIKHVSESG